jgi:hypothetical protein
LCFERVYDDTPRSAPKDLRDGPRLGRIVEGRRRRVRTDEIDFGVSSFMERSKTRPRETASGRVGRSQVNGIGRDAKAGNESVYASRVHARGPFLGSLRIGKREREHCGAFAEHKPISAQAERSWRRRRSRRAQRLEARCNEDIHLVETSRQDDVAGIAAQPSAPEADGDR